jgi:hypothetical protein
MIDMQVLQRKIIGLQVFESYPKGFQGPDMIKILIKFMMKRNVDDI